MQKDVSHEFLGMDRIFDHSFKSGRFSLVETFCDGDVIHSQIVVAVCFVEEEASPGGQGVGVGGRRYLQLLDDKLVSTNNMLIVTDERFREWDHDPGISRNALQWRCPKNKVLSLVMSRHTA